MPPREFRDAVVIPAYAESEFLPKTLDSLARNPADDLADLLVLIVVNNPAGDADDEKRQDNQRLLARLRDAGRADWPTLNLHWIDAASPAREIRGGVGGARKLGMDAALTVLRPDPRALMFCLDADALVSSNYLAAVRKAMDAAPEASGAVVEFKHQEGSTPKENEAIIAYEGYLRHYVNGLRWAGSPYAYHSIGSTMICAVDAYVKAGGMKVREGGEDFYFLQDLRKIGKIVLVADALVRPSARLSDRVPFGTGPRVREIMTGNPVLLDHPKTFKELKELLAIVDRIDTEDFKRLPALLADALPPVTREFLTKWNFADNWTKILANTKPERSYLRHAFHTWLDAFKTLKFIHFLHDRQPPAFPKLESVGCTSKIFSKE